MPIKDSDMSSLVKIAETATNNLVLPLNNFSYYPSEDLQGQIISEWEGKGLKEIGKGYYGLSGRQFYIDRLLGHVDAEGQFILLPEQKGGMLSLISVNHLTMYAPPQICYPLILGKSKHIIKEISNLDMEKGKVTLYTTDEAGSKWSLHCGRRGWGDSSYKK